MGVLGVFLTFPCHGQGLEKEGHLLLGINIAGAGLSQFGGDSPTFSSEFTAIWQFSDSWGLTTSVSIAEFNFTFDTPGSTGSMPIQTWWVEAGVSHRLFMIGRSTDVTGTLGGGLTSMRHEEEQVSLGALGTTTIPAAADSRGHVLTGVRLTHEVAHPVRLHFGTNIRFVSPFSSPETGYSVYGGFSIEVL